MAAAAAPRCHEGVDVNESKTRWITTGVASAHWGAILVTAFIIQPHLQVFQTIWLATLISSLAAVALWLTRPDHGRLAQIRLDAKLVRLENAIKDEAAHEQVAEPERKTGKLKSVV